MSDLAGAYPVDLTPQHPRLSYAPARAALQDIVDYARFAVIFVDRNGPLGWLLCPATVQGRVRALGMAPLEIIARGIEMAVRVGRLADGKIPLRLDTRLLKNLNALRQVARHEVAELDFILYFENQFKDVATLQQLLRCADDLGYRAEEEE